MIYIYDILLNFGKKEIIDFYEWDINDNVSNIKRIPLFRVDSRVLRDVYSNSVRFSSLFLTKIENKTMFKDLNSCKYLFLLTDMKDVLGIKLDDNGIILSRSILFPNDEIDIIDEAFKTSVSNISYEIIKKEKYNISFLTRKELKIQKFLLKEIDSLYKTYDMDKVSYYYFEYFNRKCIDLNKMYNELVNSLLNDFNSKWLKIYDLVKLSYN